MNSKILGKYIIVLVL